MKINPDIIVAYSFILMLPFVAVGGVAVSKWIFNTLKVRKGYYKVVFRLANYRKKTKFIKPATTTIDTGTGTASFSKDPGYVYFEGNVPVVEYNEAEEQISFQRAGKVEHDPEDLDCLLKRTYNLGQRMGREKDNKVEQLMYVCVGITGITLIVLILIVSGTLQIGSLALH